VSADKRIYRGLASLGLASGLLVFAGAIVQVGLVLSYLGAGSPLTSIRLSDPDRVKVALYLTISSACSAAMIWAGVEALRGYTRRGGLLASLSALLALSTLALPLLLGYPSSIPGLTMQVLALLIVASCAYVSFRVRGVEVKGGPFMTPLEAAFTALFSALTAVLTGTTGIMLPSPTGGYTHIGDTAIYISALLFGVKVGGLVGVIGPVVADLFVGYPRWFVTVLAHGLQGLIAGLGRKRGIILQAAILAAAGFTMSTIYFFVNIFIKGYPVALVSYFRDLFGQSLVSIILGLILTRGVERALPALRKR
jgi:uncharacterized membrane protein